MPKPPKESLDNKSLSKRMAFSFVENIKSDRKCLDFLMASVIFIVAAIELLSWNLQTENVATITDYGDNYLVYYYPLLSSLTLTVFGLFFVLKTIRYKACIYSAVISWIYLTVQAINTISIFFSIGSDLYDTIVYPILLLSIISITLIKIIRWFSKQHSHS